MFCLVHDCVYRRLVVDDRLQRLGLIIVCVRKQVMYQAPAVHPPSLEQIEELASDLNLGIAEQDLPDYHAIIARNLRGYDILEKYPEPLLPVKYPRTPGYRPQGDENRYNAWYYKTDIPGAAEGPLKGYKVAVKDSFPVAGVSMMHGSRVVEGYVPDYDPTVVTRILDAGGTIGGKAVCEEFCYSGGSNTSHPHPVLNPHDTSRTCGGSSSGCAVLVQCGDVDMAVGGDQGGSIRIPSSWTGIVGFKPTYGLVPYTGLSSLSPALDHCGPMARTVQDCARLLEAMAGDDDRLDMRQRRIPDQKDLPKYSQIDGDVSGKRVGLLKEGFLECESDVVALVERAARWLTERGAIVEDVSIPMHTDAKAIVGPTGAEGSHHAMISLQGQAIGPPSYYPTSAIDNYFAYFRARSCDLSDPVKVIHMQGKYVSDNYGLRFYAKSQNLIRLVRKKYDEALKKYDVLVMPTLKFKAPKLPGPYHAVKDFPAHAHSMLANTGPFNATGHPAISIHAGFSQELPVGMQIVGRHLEDDVVLNVAYAYEQLFYLNNA